VGTQMNEQIFRTRAKESIITPDQLNDLLKITRPKGWCALLSMGVLLVFILVWGFMGIIPTRVNGQGMFIKSGGVFNIVSTTSGQVVSLYAHVGDTIVKNQRIAIVEQPDLITKINEAKAELKECKQAYQRNSDYAKKNSAMQFEYLLKQKEHHQQVIDALIEKKNWLTQKLEAQKKILDQGLITNQAYLETLYAINQIDQDIIKTKNVLKELNINAFQVKDQQEREDLSGVQKINQAQRNLEALEKEYDIKSSIISPYTGKILEISVEEGKVVQPGNVMLTLEQNEDDNSDLEVVIYIPSTEGKKVTSGMKAQIAPSIAKCEEYGYMLGTINHVAEFPATPQGMMRVLHNETLVDSLSQLGAPIEIFAGLIKDDTTKSGYKWSSPKGFPSKIQSGTICSVKITVSEQPPITLFFPFLKKVFYGIE